ncbi:hypothetical protein NDU88_003670 [Pleurodeles waltl]|uniref:Uncharacterized protein n=1 Tax=Pleurodeles waltl TaxID=8319 RepID=A0AAV7NHB0_PLEWA|nr:hypothetical protein NDU88_003670 [Pleurodeles waltl]
MRPPSFRGAADKGVVPHGPGTRREGGARIGPLPPRLPRALERRTAPSCGWRQRGPRGGWITEEPRPEDDHDDHGGKEKKQYHTRTK